MGLIANWFRRTPQTISVSFTPSVATATKPVRKRGFDAVKSDTLLSRWVAYAHNLFFGINEELKISLQSLRGKSQDLVKNNPYVRQFLRLVTNNVVGEGVTLQSRIVDSNGNLDEAQNTLIENAWYEWCKKGNTTVDGRYSFPDVERMTFSSSVIDGEGFVRTLSVPNGKVSNGRPDAEFKLELIPAYAVDDSYNVESVGNGTKIVMGVELDKWNKVLAYHLRANKTDNKRARVPADEMIQLLNPEFLEQVRGYPWTAPIMRAAKLLDGYQEAELVAARTAAAKMGFFTSKTGDEVTGDGQESEGGAIVMNAGPGEMVQLPEGVNFTSWDPQHPTTGYADFVKEVLRSLASGLGVPYYSLASDGSSINFSTARQFALEERSHYRCLQRWMIENFHQIIFERWLKHELLTGHLKLPAEKFDKFNKASWLPRSWGWVDPSKDIDASLSMVRANLKSLTQVAAEQGVDFEDVVKQRQREVKLLRDAGLPDGLAPVAKPAEPSPPKEDDDDKGG